MTRSTWDVLSHASPNVPITMHGGANRTGLDQRLRKAQGAFYVIN